MFVSRIRTTISSHQYPFVCLCYHLKVASERDLIASPYRFLKARKRDTPRKGGLACTPSLLHVMHLICRSSLCISADKFSLLSSILNEDSSRVPFALRRFRFHDSSTSIAHSSYYAQHTELNNAAYRIVVREIVHTIPRAYSTRDVVKRVQATCSCPSSSLEDYRGSLCRISTALRDQVGTTSGPALGTNALIRAS